MINSVELIVFPVPRGGLWVVYPDLDALEALVVDGVYVILTLHCGKYVHGLQMVFSTSFV